MTATPTPAEPDPGSNPSGLPTPTGRAGFTIFVGKAGGSRFTRTTLRHVVRRPLTNPVLQTIASKRRALMKMSGFVLEPSVYGSNRDTISPRNISIPGTYGEVLYSLVSFLKPSLAVEAGAGFGVSGMYIAAGLRETSGVLISSELSEYADIAQAAVREISPSCLVIKASFSTLFDRLDARQKVDFAFIDHVHDYATMVRSFRSLVGWCSPGAIIVFDDLDKDQSTRLAWREIISTDHVTFAARINNRLGLIEVGHLPKTD